MWQYPPCTSLTCTKLQWIGSKRVLQVKASVSTRRPDVGWCQHPTDEPPENRARVPESLGPFALQKLDMQSFDCHAFGRYDEEAQSLHLEEHAATGLTAVWCA